MLKPSRGVNEFGRHCIYMAGRSLEVWNVFLCSILGVLLFQKENGGLIMVNLHSGFVACHGQANVSIVAGEQLPLISVYWHQTIKRKIDCLVINQDLFRRPVSRISITCVHMIYLIIILSFDIPLNFCRPFYPH